MDMGQFNHESASLYYSEGDQDDEFMIKDNTEFHEARESYISQIEDISKMLRHQRNMKKIKKDCMKNMIAGPCLLEGQVIKHPSCSIPKEICTGKMSQKNS